LPRNLAGMLAATLLMPGLRAPLAAEWSGYASIGSDYIFRGASLLDSGPALQLGGEVHFAEYLVAGAAAARVDQEWLYQVDTPDHLELDVYAGAEFGCGPRCHARLLLTHYAFPGPGTRDWTEASASVSYADRIGASLAWGPEGLGSRRSARTLEAWVQQPLSRYTSVEAGYGSIAIGGFDYWYAHAGISHRVDRFVFDLSEHWSSPSLRRFEQDHNQHLVLTISTAF
jgi:hypothetical protein